MKKLLTVLLTVMMAFTVITVNVFASEEIPTAEKLAVVETVQATTEESDENKEETEKIDEISETIADGVINETEVGTIVEEITEEIEDTTEKVEELTDEVVKVAEDNLDAKKKKLVIIKFSEEYQYGEVEFYVIDTNSGKELKEHKDYSIHFYPNFKETNGEANAAEDNAAKLFVGSWKAVITLKDTKNYRFDEKFSKDGKTAEINFKVVKKLVNIPLLYENELIYNGEAQSPNFAEGFDSKIMEKVNGRKWGETWTATNAGDYYALVKLKDSRNYEWNIKSKLVKAADNREEASYYVDGDTLYIRWSIVKNKVDFEELLDKTGQRTYNGKEQQPFELPAGVYFGYETWGIDNSAVNAGTYKASIWVDTNNCETRGIELDRFGRGTLEWTILPARLIVQANVTRTYGKSDITVDYVTLDGTEFYGNDEAILTTGRHAPISYKVTDKQLNNPKHPVETVKEAVTTTADTGRINNYRVGVVPGNYTINPATLSIKLVFSSIDDELDHFTYNGKSQTPKIQFEGVAPWDHVGTFDYVVLFTDGEESTKIEDYVGMMNDYRNGANVNLNLTSKDAGTKNYIIGLFGDIAKNYELEGQDVIPTILGDIKYVVDDYQIEKAPLTITVNDAKMYRKKALPEFTYEITEGKIMPGDYLRCELGLAEDADTTKVGKYDIIATPKIYDDGFLYVKRDITSLNYDVTVVNGTLTVKKHHKTDDTIKIVSTGIE
ncbi:MAG: MBG domain-containing protein [Erysipelotrichaceae bacterium]|nr:MBG domain-containing protein [Erysipelotrichaceae bacterium]